MASVLIASRLLAEELQNALIADGSGEIAMMINAAEVERCTFADDDGICYIYLRRPPFPVPEVHAEAAQVKYTIDLMQTVGANVDIDHEGNVFGIEVIGRKDIVTEVKHFVAA